MSSIFDKINIISKNDNIIYLETNLDLLLSCLKSFEKANSPEFRIILQRGQNRLASLSFTYSTPSVSNQTRIPVRILKSDIAIEPFPKNVKIIVNLPPNFQFLYKRMDKFKKIKILNIIANVLSGLDFVLEDDNRFKVTLHWNDELEMKSTMIGNETEGDYDMGANDNGNNGFDGGMRGGFNEMGGDGDNDENDKIDGYNENEYNDKIDGYNENDHNGVGSGHQANGAGNSKESASYQKSKNSNRLVYDEVGGDEKLQSISSLKTIQNDVRALDSDERPRREINGDSHQILKSRGLNGATSNASESINPSFRSSLRFNSHLPEHMDLSVLVKVADFLPSVKLLQECKTNVLIMLETECVIHSNLDESADVLVLYYINNYRLIA